MPGTATLLIICPDRPGIVAAVATGLYQAGANIVHADQHIDRTEDLFLQRVEFDLDGLELSEVRRGMTNLADRFEMRWALREPSPPPRVALLASRQGHCLTDLLARWDMGDLPGAPAVVVSNHPDHADLARHHDLPYHHLAITAETKSDQEDRLLEVLGDADVDLVVLARYMQILSPRVVNAFAGRIINIHHSFLPAFAGGRPYHQAHERGVKIIGATAHYVTADLDEGPIIDQDVIRVSHRDEVEDLVRKGRDLEKLVLSRAVRYHLENRILVYRNKTVVFD